MYVQQSRTFASVERFLAEVINHRASRGQTPLMLACANGCVRHLHASSSQTL